MAEGPNHIGLILDGNRRWARSNHLPVFEGHRRGKDTLHKIAVAARDRGVKYLSAYVFSTENWKREQPEVDFLMELIVTVATLEIDRYIRDGIRVVFLGSRDGLSQRVKDAIDSSEAKTAHNDKLLLGLCFNYGGQQEIVDAVRAIVGEGVDAKSVTAEMLEQHLYHPEIPPIDLVIRSSGEMRISNFMLWRAAYAELMFTDKYWPAFTEEDLDAALDEYGRRHRRYGK